MKVGIIGMGEIGTAIKQVYEKAKNGYSIFEKDIAIDEFVLGMEYMHICIPYQSEKQFTDVVKENIKHYEPQVVVIHSTVHVGTTEKLFEQFGNVVHSPVRGVHPIIYEGLKTFSKFIGSENDELGRKVERHFYELGVESIFVKGSRNTEAAKIWSTTQYGIDIIMQKEIHRYCEKNELNFDVVYGLWNQSYNEGYRKMGRLRYQRYVLAHVPGKIGGHCVCENAGIIPEEDMAQVILRKQEGYKQGKEVKLFEKEDQE